MGNRIVQDNSPRKTKFTFDEAVDVWLRRWGGQFQHEIAAAYVINVRAVNQVLKEVTTSAARKSRRQSALPDPIIGNPHRGPRYQAGPAIDDVLVALDDQLQLVHEQHENQCAGRGNGPSQRNHKQQGVAPQPHEADDDVHRR